jgi:hypothetical protein
MLVVMVSAALAIPTGCASKKATQAGFLENYPVFEPGPKEGADWVYFKKGVNFGAYNKVMMDHVVFYLKDDAEYKGIHADELKELADAFHKAVVEALEGAYPLVDKPGPDAMRIRPAITEVVPSKRGLSAVTTVIPVGLALSTIKKGVTGQHTGVGKATLEVEILDSLTNERIAAAIDTKAGGKLSGVTKWGAAKDAFEFWAKRLRAFLDEAHGRK